MSIVKLNNRGVKDATAFGSITGLGSMTLIKKLTASSSATLSFVDGASSVVLDNTYKEYLFTFNNMHPSSASNFAFQGSTNTGSSYGVNITSSHFQAKHDENGSGAALSYEAGRDLAQSTSFQRLTETQNTANDECCAGFIKLFNPSSTTFVKHFIATFQSISDNPSSSNNYCAGYFNTTSPVDAFQFKFESGDIASGDICLYGIA
tara:strand:- start:229 stop:846 length:618 start_codon:yes stop_codon:yes gene_type:complete